MASDGTCPTARIPLRACSVIMIWLADMDSAIMNRMFGRVRSNVVTKLLGHAYDRSGLPQDSASHATITCDGVPRLQPFRSAQSTGSPPHPDMIYHTICTARIHSFWVCPGPLKSRPATSSRRRSPTSGSGALGLDQTLQKHRLRHSFIHIHRTCGHV